MIVLLNRLDFTSSINASDGQRPNQMIAERRARTESFDTIEIVRYLDSNRQCFNRHIFAGSFVETDNKFLRNGQVNTPCRNFQVIILSDRIRWKHLDFARCSFENRRRVHTDFASRDNYNCNKSRSLTRTRTDAFSSLARPRRARLV